MASTLSRLRGDMAKCEHCPVAGVCRGQRDGWQFVCLMAARGDHSEALRLAELDRPRPAAARPGGCNCKSIQARIAAKRESQKKRDDGTKI